ncbi:5669_t:CDS:2 [Ambispora gerdemannii]|uniref:Cytochrome b-c1 complex subunit 8 n=1 Tax=Ambispora gerdemannii TaxID=144530 RepID=A0A9N8VYX9_9GLOM|nr:5669_t:CDS:2 [Ambispora gerdemannii]
MGGHRHPWWGFLGGPVQRGIVTYSLSPYEQRAFAGALKYGYGVYRWGTERYHYLHSKAGHAELEAITK